MNDRWMVIPDERAWRVACVGSDRARVFDLDCPADAELQTRSQALARLINARSGSSASVLLAIPSNWCLSAMIDTRELARAGRRQAMAYLLEEQLPLSAEDAVVDFCQLQGQALGVAAELRRLQPIVDALRDAGVGVRHICPIACLIGAQLAQRYPQRQTLCIAGETGIDLIRISQNTPTRWWYLPDRAGCEEQLAAWVRELGDGPRSAVTLGGQVALAGLEPLEADADSDQAGEPGAASGVEYVAASEAARILAGEVSPWIDLCQGPLASAGRHTLLQKHMTRLVAALVLLLVCTGVATYWRSLQYAELAGQMNAQQIAIYKELMPGQRIPPSIHGRLMSEYRRLSGPDTSSAGNASANEQLQPTSALTHLHALLSVWPQSARCRLADLSIEPTMIRVNGQAADSVIPEQFVNALRAQGKYQVDEPNSRALSDFGFAFSFIARPMTSDTKTSISAGANP